MTIGTFQIIKDYNPKINQRTNKINYLIKFSIQINFHVSDYFIIKTGDGRFRDKIIIKKN